MVCSSALLVYNVITEAELNYLIFVCVPFGLFYRLLFL